MGCTCVHARHRPETKKLEETDFSFNELGNGSKKRITDKIRELFSGVRVFFLNAKSNYSVVCGFFFNAKSATTSGRKVFYIITAVKSEILIVIHCTLPLKKQQQNNTF